MYCLSQSIYEGCILSECLHQIKKRMFNNTLTRAYQTTYLSKDHAPSCSVCMLVMFSANLTSGVLVKLRSHVSHVQYRDSKLINMDLHILSDI